MNLEDIETHSVASLARRLLTSRATVGRMLCFGRLKAAKETASGAFYRRADLDRLREEEIGKLKEKCGKLDSTERELLSAYFAEKNGGQKGRETPDNAEMRAGVGSMQTAGDAPPTQSTASGARVTMTFGDGPEVELKQAPDGTFQLPKN